MKINKLKLAVGLTFAIALSTSSFVFAENMEIFSENLDAVSTSPAIKISNVQLIALAQNTLIVATPEEGKQLAMKMARLTVKATQPDAKVREELRGVYSHDAGMLIGISQAVATEFATIAVANNYWKDKPNNMLIVATPEEGKQLAMKMARLTVKATQPDAKVREELRKNYPHDVAILLAISRATATEFSTIAKANNYWKDKVKAS